MSEGSVIADTDSPAQGDDRLCDLLHLASSVLPVGSYAYSQGLEWAVEEGLVHDLASLANWLASLLELQLVHQELPLLLRLHEAFAADSHQDVQRWNAMLLALRETSELRLEELARGQSLLRLLDGLGMLTGRERLVKALGRPSFTATFALAAVVWGIPPAWAARGWAWAWLEAQVIAGVKLIPLGQLDGQRLLLSLRARIPAALTRARSIGDDAIGMTAIGLALASTAHESQYSRLFRS